MGSSSPEPAPGGTLAPRGGLRKVLVVAPNFPPVAAPDMHRVRMACAHFAEFGWEPLVLAVDPALQPAPRDDSLAATLPAQVRVWRTRALPERATRLLGFGNVAWRALPFLARAGSRLIAAERPAVALFSTTMFAAFLLGPWWRRRHGLPYVLDLQDPWLASAGAVGEGARRRLANVVAGLLEPPVMRAAAHVLCVSSQYPPMLRARYPDIAQERLSVLPFGGAERDFEAAAACAPCAGLPPAGDGLLHWVYAGAVSPPMRFAVHAILLALARARATGAQPWARLRLHFIGTRYAAGDPADRPIERLARELGVGDLVRESPQRLPYLDTLQWLRRADALVVLGSTDPGYSASKVFPCILARKPLLALMNASSNVAQIVERTRAGTLVTFGGEETVEAVAQRIGEQWFAGGWSQPPRTDWSAFEPYTARRMTARLCAILDDAAEGPRRA